MLGRETRRDCYGVHEYRQRRNLMLRDQGIVDDGELRREKERNDAEKRSV